MNASKNIFRLSQLVCRSAARNSSSGAVNTVPSARYAAMKTKQAAIGVEDGVPVHLKTGFTDRILLVTTYVLVSVGTAGGLHAFYTCLFR